MKPSYLITELDNNLHSSIIGRGANNFNNYKNGKRKNKNSKIKKTLLSVI